MTQPAPTLSLRNIERLGKIAEHLKAARALAANNERGGWIHEPMNCLVRFLHLDQRDTVTDLNRLATALDGEHKSLVGLRAQARDDEPEYEIGPMEEFDDPRESRHDPDPEMAALNAADEAYHERKENP